MDWGLVTFFVTDLIVGALVINIWEEMAWTGFFQRRATSRWGAVGGSLVTSIFFTGIHVPLAFDGADGAHAVATNLLFIAGVAVGVRLLVARIDPWSGYSLLTIGVLHSSFNASESMLEADHDWVRIAVTIAAGIGVAALGAPTRSDG
jgi:membrane protease YdiL (CAAX protease family)